MVDLERLASVKKELIPYNATLVAVSKTKPAEAIEIAYKNDQYIFGENYVQELCEKQAALPKDIQWHFIGHLQSNKVKQITPFISLIHGIDSKRLLEEVDRQALKAGRIVNCLLQVYIATEESKFGLDYDEAIELLSNNENFPNVAIKGFMGMATNTDDKQLIKKEFTELHNFYDSLRAENNLTILSMGMTADYRIALDCGSNMVRIGSALFGERQVKQ